MPSAITIPITESDLRVIAASGVAITKTVYSYIHIFLHGKLFIPHPAHMNPSGNEFIPVYTGHEQPPHSVSAPPLPQT